MNIVHRIVVANADRDPIRVAMKYRMMRASCWSFFRGTCHLFYDRLPKNGIARSAPPVWSCGDLHLENFGSYKGDNRLVYFDINDFDEAAISPASWDLARMLTSILVRTATLGLSKGNTHALASEFIAAYLQTLRNGRALWVERDTAQGIVHGLLEGARARPRTAFLAQRTRRSGLRRHLRLDGKKLLPVSDAQRTAVTAFMAAFASSQLHPAFYRMIDVAVRVAGTGSLGVDRYAILVEGKGSPDMNYLLDLKQSRPSTLAVHLASIQPTWRTEAERIVAVQQRMQAAPMAFLHAVDLGGRAYVLRALQPSEDRVDLAAIENNVDSLLGVIRVMGQCLAAAQLRSAGRQGSASADQLIAFAGRKKLPGKLMELAFAMAERTTLDWAIYCQAYDDGRFDVDNGCEPA